VPYGTGAHDLVNVQGGQGSSPDNWTVTWESAKSAFLAVPPSSSGGTVGPAGVQLTLKGLHINTRPGTATIDIAEMTATTPGSYSMRRDECSVTKFPRPAVPAQNVSDFAATTPEVNAGNTVTLHWTGPQTLTYSIAHGTGATPATGQTETNITNFTWKGTVTRDTTFHLHYRLGETTHTLTATVAVNNPRLTGLTVNGKLYANDDVHATGGGKIVRIRELLGPHGGPLTINSNGIHYIEKAYGVDLAGAVTARKTMTVDGSLTVNGAVEANGDVYATGKDRIVRIRELRGPVGEHLSINSSTDFLRECDVCVSDSFRVGGSLVSNGLAEFKGKARIIGSDHQLCSFSNGSGGLVRSFTAPTDGLVIGYLRSGSIYEYGSIEIVGARVREVTGFTDRIATTYWHELVGPIRMGEQFTVRFKALSDKHSYMSGGFLWRPVGLTSEKPTEVSPDDLLRVDVSREDPPACDTAKQDGTA
ncbi:hypothetical protein, partial [Streptomyces corynorhini]|uniref:hypothetical protein n=1 Tax=Streptomyces corynorhini TaxID=2282652 RepID=UPI0013142E65